MSGSAPRRDHHLPVETTSFVDRRGDLAAGRELLARTRLVTLTGPGGVGKTRLAARIAAGVRRTFPDGVRVVHLSGWTTRRSSRSPPTRSTCTTTPRSRRSSRWWNS